MESPDSGSGLADCDIGSIVWVRRRNGSWWPGKILGPQELAASHLMSPRSGTPVKLLGREDASVDWYNLEKSKRVKAFRCGEFDECIERAEASLGIPPKKREKYARREDAILHALELEKQYLGKKSGKMGYSLNGKGSKSCQTRKKWLAHSGSKAQSKSHQRSNRTSSDGEDNNKDHHLYSDNVKEENQLSGDENGSTVPPRMKGIQDFGLRSVPSKLKLSSTAPSNGSQVAAVDDGCQRIPVDGLGAESMPHANGANDLDKRKRPQEGQVDGSAIKKRDRRRPLLKVLESSAKFPDTHSSHIDYSTHSLSVSGDEEPGIARGPKRSRLTHHTAESSYLPEDKKYSLNQIEITTSNLEENCSPPAASSEDTNSSSTEDTETDSSETDSLESDSDEGIAAPSDDASIELKPKYPERFEARGEYVSFSSEEVDEVDDLALSNDISRYHPNDFLSSSVGMSKWQLKGKRNSRVHNRRTLDVSGEEVFKGSIHGRELDKYGFDESYSIEKKFGTQMIGYGSWGFDSYKGHNIVEWEDLSWNDQPALKRRWEDPDNYFHSLFVRRRHFGGKRNLLVDVDLKVQSSYQREHVPMISLMSKLNGRAIVGHPVQIEKLEYGASEMLLEAADDFCPEASGDTAIPSTWKTARRTANFRVPRPHPLSSLPGDETAEYWDRGRKVSFQKPDPGRVTASNASFPAVENKFSRKPSKKISQFSSQKTRTLSSIATQQKHSGDSKHGSNSFQADGLIKPASVPTTVACIPVKLVFSRLYEELVARHQ